MQKPRSSREIPSRILMLGALALSLSACHRMTVYERSYSPPISSQNFQDVDDDQVPEASTIVRGRGHWEPGHECSNNCSEYEPPVTSITPIETAPTAKRVVIIERRVERSPETRIHGGFYQQTVVYRHGHHLHRCGPSCGFYYSTRRVYLHGHHLHVCNSGCRFYSGIRYTITNRRPRRHLRRRRGRFGFSFGTNYGYCR